MPVTTIKNINAAIEHHNVEICKGTGYFYFAPLPGAPNHLDDLIPSIYTCHLRDMSVQQYVDYVEDNLKT
jgi:hypothetical protein